MRSVSLRSVSLTLALLASLMVASTAAPSTGEDLEDRLWDLHIAPLNAAPAPAFSLESLAKERVTLSDLRGRAVLLYFWATW